jgi:hypothetical protein
VLRASASAEGPGIRDGFEVWGYDRDPSHEPEEHMHRGADHTREASGRVTFKDVAEKAWETTSQEEALAADSDPVDDSP